MLGTLYIVATSIGNLDDVTFRALKILKEVDYIIAEDTRVTAKLLQHYDIKVDTLIYNQHSSFDKKEKILNLLLQGKNIALVTDAGTPGVSDPGNELIDFLTQHSGIRVVPIPGSSSVTAALSVCGFNTSNFLFIGFWPKKKAKKLINKLEKLEMPVVFFESPYRIIKTLELIKANLGEKRIFVGQELTKLYERNLRSTISEVISTLEVEQKELGRIKGELVCVLEG